LDSIGLAELEVFLVQSMFIYAIWHFSPFIGVCQVRD